MQKCPSWMNNEESFSKFKDKEPEDDLDEPDYSSAGLFFKSIGTRENEAVNLEVNSKEEILIEDQEEQESGER